MPNKKMSFPKVPGDTPREQFENLVRHVFFAEKHHNTGSSKRSEKKKALVRREHD